MLRKFSQSRNAPTALKTLVSKVRRLERRRHRARMQQKSWSWQNWWIFKESERLGHKCKAIKEEECRARDQLRFFVHVDVPVPLVEADDSDSDEE